MREQEKQMVKSMKLIRKGLKNTEAVFNQRNVHQNEFFIDRKKQEKMPVMFKDLFRLKLSDKVLENKKEEIGKPRKSTMMNELVLYEGEDENSQVSTIKTEEDK